MESMVMAGAIYFKLPIFHDQLSIGFGKDQESIDQGKSQAERCHETLCYWMTALETW